MDYFVFLLVNANLFLRPAELVPALEKLQLYAGFILACLIVSVPKLMGLFSGKSPLRHPVTWCVLGVFVFVGLSHLAQSEFDRMAEETFEFFKVVVYFVLFLAVVHSPAKLRGLVTCVILFGVITTGTSVLEYHQVIDLPNLKTNDAEFNITERGELARVQRLMLTGILHDPNEFCIFLGILVLFTLYKLTNREIGIVRFGWLLPMALFMYGISLTQSRGGLMALLLGLGAYAVCTWGVRRAMVAGAMLLPLMFLALVLGGAERQTSISLTEGTGRARMELWSDWLMKFRESPVFGEAPKITVSTLPEEAKMLRYNTQQVAHNSYLQAFADLGIVGGMLFMAAFFFAFRTMTRFRTDQINIVDPELRRMYPFLFGALTAYMTGMLSLSLCYVLPTYFVLAIPVVFANMTATEPAVEEVRWDGTALRGVVFASVGMLAFVFVCIKVFRV